MPSGAVNRYASSIGRQLTSSTGILIKDELVQGETVMSVPTQTEMDLIVLKLMLDGEKRTRAQAKEAIRQQLGLSEEECSLKTSSGVRVYESRVGWSVSYLSRAEMLHAVKRGLYEITDFGRTCAEQYTDSKAFYYFLKKTIAERNPWKHGGSEPETQPSKEVSEAEQTGQEGEVSPQEQIDAAFTQLNDDLQEALLQSILEKDPTFFEQLVVDLLVKMGYGQGRPTQVSNDGGIDGIIATDALGFDPIYVQAKRYTPGNTVGRPELQGFAGALGSISRGVFITTSSFAKSAVEWASHYPHATLVLIDGKRLTELMVQYDLGVSTERVYRIKRLDGDYFGDE